MESTISNGGFRRAWFYDTIVSHFRSHKFFFPYFLRSFHDGISDLPRHKEFKFRDRISELPDCVLLHIMNFLDIKYAIGTCVLSKRWMNLCKKLTKITFSYNCNSSLGPCHSNSFKKFVSWVLFSRDNSYSLFNLRIKLLCAVPDELLDSLVKYALFHKVQDLELHIYSFKEFPHLIFCCQTLTSLKLSGIHPYIIIPKSLHLPALKVLELHCVKFTASHDGSIEPFSNCRVLNTLVLGMCCFLDSDAQVLRISSSTLSALTILWQNGYNVELSTPSLSSFTIKYSISGQLFSTCNLSFLEEVNIELIWCSGNSSILVTWLHVLASVKTLTFTIYRNCIGSIRRDIEDHSIPQPPSFDRLELLKVKIHPCEKRSDEEITSIMKFFLQNSPMARVIIISSEMLQNTPTARILA